MAIGYLDSQYLTDIADAIRAKDGSSSTMTISEMPQKITDIPTGGGTDPIAVRFLDFDGTVVDELTDVELTALTQLPSAPDHSQDEIPLTFDEWNWLLADIKTFRTANPTYTINVGANYHTTDNKYHAIIGLPYDGISFSVNVGNRGCIVDWGDGNTETVNSGTKSHTYTSKGRYNVSLEPRNTGYTDLTCGFSGSQQFITDLRLSNVGNLRYLDTYKYGSLKTMSQPSTSTNVDTSWLVAIPSQHQLEWFSIPRRKNTSVNFLLGKYQPLIYGITSLPQYAYSYSDYEQYIIPSTVATINGYGFTETSVREITVPASVTSIGISAFATSKELRHVKILGGITTLPEYVFSECYKLETVELPSTLTTIGNRVFYQDCLRSLTIPENVTSIGNYVIYDPVRIVLTMKPTIPPTIQSNSFIFNGGSYLIIVPYSADHSVLNAYKTAQNWSSFASYIIEDDPPASS